MALIVPHIHCSKKTIIVLKEHDTKKQNPEHQHQEFEKYMSGFDYVLVVICTYLNPVVVKMHIRSITGNKIEMRHSGLNKIPYASNRL